MLGATRLCERAEGRKRSKRGESPVKDEVRGVEGRGRADRSIVGDGSGGWKRGVRV